MWREDLGAGFDGDLGWPLWFYELYLSHADVKTACMMACYELTWMMVLLGPHHFSLFIKNGDTAGYALWCRLIDIDVGIEGGMIP